MSTPGSMTRWADELRSPDRMTRDEAARNIWERYSSRLVVIVRRNLTARIQQRADPEDVLQSMYKSFCSDRQQSASPLAGREDLWRLLVHITLCKAANAARHHAAERRDVRRELPVPNDGPPPDWMLDWMDRREPSPLDALMVEEEFEAWLTPLTSDLRQIALWKVEGYTNKEIGAKIGRTERTVELKLGIIRSRLEERARAEVE